MENTGQLGASGTTPLGLAERIEHETTSEYPLDLNSSSVVSAVFRLQGVRHLLAA